MQTHKDHHCSIQQEIEGLQLTLQVDFSTGSFESHSSDSGLYAIALTAEERSDLLVKAASQALVAARHQFHQSLGLSFIALKQAENDRLATAAGKNKDKFTPPSAQHQAWVAEIADLADKFSYVKLPVIVTTPQGYGKAELLTEVHATGKFKDVMDEWAPGKPLYVGCLHLTNVHPNELRHLDALIVERGWQ